MSLSHVEYQDLLHKQLFQLLEAAQVLSGGLSDTEKTYHLKKIPLWLAYARKAVGFFPGSRAYIVDEIKCDGGWKGEELNLAVGKAGTVEDVDVDDSLTLRILFTPDSQVWVPSETYVAQGITKGVPVPVEKNRFHSFWLRESHLKPLGPG